MITCESQVTLQSQIASTRLQYSMAGQVFTATECVPQVVQVSDRLSLQEEFMDFCMSPLPPQVFVKFSREQGRISKTKWEIKSCPV